jgi:hypothetical protein
MKITTPVLSLLYDPAMNRWHPVVFDSRPVTHPGHRINRRLSSVAHHSAGFGSRAEAMEAARHIAETLVNTGCSAACEIQDRDTAWRGEWPILLPRI